MRVSSFLQYPGEYLQDTFDNFILKKKKENQMLTAINRILPTERKTIWFKILEQLHKLLTVHFFNTVTQQNTQTYTPCSKLTYQQILFSQVGKLMVICLCCTIASAGS